MHRNTKGFFLPRPLITSDLEADTSWNRMSLANLWVFLL